MKTVLFVAYGGGHVNTLLPVYKSLSQNENVRCVFLALTTAGLVLERENIPYIGFRDLLQDSDSEALEKGRELAGDPAQHTVVPYEESVAYMGLSYMDLVAEKGSEDAARLYQQGGRQYFYPLKTMQRLLSDLGPDLIVATNSPRAEKAAMDAASGLGIPALCVIDLFAMKEVEWLGKPGYASRLCVLSEFVKQRLVEHGRAPDDIVVTGNPAFDQLYTEEKCSDAFRERKGWPSDHTVVLWASNVEPEYHPYSSRKGDVKLPEKIEYELIKWVEAQPDRRAVFRPHPNDIRRPDISHPRVELSTQDDDLSTLLNAVDCVVVTVSTVGLQAALVNKPLVNVKLSIFSENAPYDVMELSEPVYDLEQFGQALDCAIENGQPGIGLPVAGCATGNVVREIERLLR
ncbi:CDP-glycerol glycerophosphotransferase family protein [Marinobacterium jannaschii]|uniref:CDP-glycerol glycerophosphotransferase family protein n=1 Tax=Marinobacterium jannaschii TaxID=64970 RepID=UPI00047F692C|nr:CDP-glycerol glycerophosphotransferase family protein [Marinobacterium jannaschii]